MQVWTGKRTIVGGRTVNPVREQPESMTRTTVFLMLANVLRNISLLLVLLFLAQLTEPEVVGNYALALAITTPVFAFAQFGLRGVFLTLRAQVRLSSYAIVQTIGVLSATALSLAIVCIVDPPLASTVLLVSFFKGADAYCDLFAAPLQQHGRSDLVFWGFLTSALAGGSAVGALLAATENLDIALAGMALVSVLVTVFLFAIPAIRIVAQVKNNEKQVGAVRVIFAAGLPTGLSLSVLALIPTMPQYVLAWSVGSIAVGYFVVVLYTYMTAELFTGALVQSWLPHARDHFETQVRRRGDFLRWVIGHIVKWTALFLPITGAGFLGAMWVYPILFPDYPLSFDLILPLTLTILLLPALYFTSAAMSVRNLYSHSLTVGAVAVTASVAASLLLIPVFGVPGALWATFAGVAGRTGTAITIVVLAELRTDGPRDAQEIRN